MVIEDEDVEDGKEAVVDTDGQNVEQLMLP
jgi:hypothetical protein